jgi:hypothetical protein
MLGGILKVYSKADFRAAETGRIFNVNLWMGPSSVCNTSHTNISLVSLSAL